MNTLEIIDTQEKAYILGLCFADAYASGSYISLKDGDQDILFTIANYLELPAPVYKEPDPSRYSKKGYWRLGLKHNAILLRKHWGANKIAGAKKLILPTVPPTLLNHFLRGLFDGDGCYSIDNRYVTKYPDMAVPGLIYVLLNEEEHAKQIQDSICMATNLNHTNIIKKTGNGSRVVYKLIWSGTNNIVTLRNWLYTDATIYLQRKKLIADQFKVGDRIMAARRGGTTKVNRARHSQPSRNPR